MTIVEIAQAELSALEAAGVLRRVPHSRDHIKVYESSHGLVALETSRSSRERVSAKFWFSFTVPIPEAEFYPAGRGRSHALRGLRVDERHDAWAVLISNRAPDAHERLDAALDLLRVREGGGPMDVPNSALASRRDA